MYINGIDIRNIRHFNDQLIRGYEYVRRMEEAHNLGSGSGFNYPV